MGGIYGTENLLASDDEICERVRALGRLAFVGSGGLSPPPSALLLTLRPQSASPLS